MTAPDAHEVTRLLVQWSNGSRTALDELTPLVYAELRRLAGRYAGRERRHNTLQATDLAHEAYLKLVDQRRVRWRDRVHFFAVAAQAMRRILVDHARRRRAAKRGGDGLIVPLTDPAPATAQPAVDLLALDEALSRLATIDARQSRIVELRFFGGFTIEEVAEVMGLSAATVTREWRMARTWLHREMCR